MTAIDELAAAARALVDRVTFDVCGADGRGGNGGLVSVDTIRACDRLRLALDRFRPAPDEAAPAAERT